MSDRFLSLKQVREKTSLGKTWIYELERRGEFPRRRQVTPTRVRWLESEVDGWMGQKQAVDLTPPTELPKATVG